MTMMIRSKLLTTLGVRNTCWKNNLQRSFLRLYSEEVQGSPKNGVYERYQEKLKQKAKQEETPLEKLVQNARKSFAPKQAISESQELAEKSNKKPQVKKVKKFPELSDFIDVSKFQSLPASVIEKLWRARNLQENILSGCVEKQTYERMISRAKKYPIFVLPLPRENQGMETHLIQWGFPGNNTAHLIITTLLEYKLKNAYATPHTVLTHFSDLLESNGVALMRCQFEQDKTLSSSDVQLLLLAIQKFYNASPDSALGKERLSLLENFANGKDFDLYKVAGHMDMLE
ncbi:mitochondrial F1-FO ATP synthase chaperone Atp11 [Schizosaccharomyces osmophilus]|uniref:Mitochondrial F1-FO ATP synthase chaperone Atp11 n=1 Tax=Schizosaccharomyces osmophilus TaxID=2545709 RepID=A0AAE9WA61_9SCHI|nr:mitochondrial F1-FO ATP synthase chaperone Atp11 [Schizosaccharomyces osmophilus]WBW72115.1 mitochondrial F1-FO ATP synthase chaperone Atp11 [Schizosaccharomyces osmophilus]